MRYGLDGELLDLDRAEAYPAAEAVERLLTWSAPVRAELGIEVALPALNGAQRQRRMTDAGVEPGRDVRRGRGRDPRHVCCERSAQGAAQVTPMSPDERPREPTEEELRAAYEAELKRLRVEHVLLDNVVALANLGMRRTGLAPGTEDERDPEQVRLAIESIRALLPVLEQAAPAQVGAIRDAVSQLQLALRADRRSGARAELRKAVQRPGLARVPARVRLVAPSGAAPRSPRPKPGEPGPAQRSGRLWVPGPVA